MRWMLALIVAGCGTLTAAAEAGEQRIGVVYIQTITENNVWCKLFGLSFECR